MQYLLDIRAMRDLLGMYDEYRMKHGYADDAAKSAAINETTDPDAGYRFDDNALARETAARAAAEADARKAHDEVLTLRTHLKSILQGAKQGVRSFSTGIRGNALLSIVNIAERSLAPDTAALSAGRAQTGGEGGNGS